MTEAEIVGVVEGTAGEVVGGWAQVAQRPRRGAVGVIKVRTADDRVVEVEIGSATIEPVARETAAWQTLEGSAAARMCADDAPAPDAEVELRSALIRGGDRIAAWGEVIATELVGGGPRDGATPAVRRLAATAVAVGDGCEARLDEVKAEHARRQAKQRADGERAEAGRRKKQDKVRAEADAKGESDIVDRVRHPWGLYCVGAGAAIGAAWCAFLPSSWLVPTALAMCVLLAWPLVLDAMFLAPFRTLPAAKRKTMEIPGVAFIIIGALAMMCAYGYGDLLDETPARARTTLYVGFGLAGLAFVAAAICVFGTRARRRMLRRLAVAPPHPRPIADGVWGATDGRFIEGTGGAKVGGRTMAIATGESVHVWGTATGVGTKNYRPASSSSTPLEGFAPKVELEAADGARVTVELTGARWYASTELTVSTGEKRYDTAHVVAFGRPVRVVGRAKDGVIKVGARETLLVFASAGDVAPAVGRAWRREQLGLALAAAGVIGWAVLLVRQLAA